jgi:V8-like Glu-specific endopeptidase
MTLPFKKPRRPARSALLAATIAAVALLGIASPAAASTPSAERVGSKQAVLAEWTPRQMRRAKPLAVPSSSPAHRSAGTARVPSPSGSPLRVPPTLPAPDAGPAASSFPLPDATAYPQRSHGRLFARMKGVGPYSCSATVVSSPAASTVLTAAHCVKQPRGPWASRLVFVPAYDRGAAPFGRWAWKRAWVNRGWVRWASSNVDVAAVRIAPRGGSSIADTVGARGIVFDGAVKQRYEAFGYPSNKANGERPWGCESNFARRDPHYLPPGPRPIGIRCDMGHGASGGGWVDPDGLLASLTSFAYGDRPRVIYGPYLSGAAKKLWRKAGRA